MFQTAGILFSTKQIPSFHFSTFLRELQACKDITQVYSSHLILYKFIQVLFELPEWF
jgi:hypothetical protein